MSTTTPEQLFSLPIPRLDSSSSPDASISATIIAPSICALTFSSPPDNRLTTPFLTTLLRALDILTHHPRTNPQSGAVILLTSASPKFFSNGLNLEHAVATEGYWPLLYEFWARLLTYPNPLVAVVAGHCFAGGLMTATCCDYVLAPRGRGYLCLNELEFGAPLKPPMAGIFKAKVGPKVLRDMVLEARRFSGEEALAVGLADGLVASGDVAKSLEEAVQFVGSRKLVGKSKSGVYGVLKGELWKELSGDLMRGKGRDAHDARFDGVQELEEQIRTRAEKVFKEWEAGEKKNGKAKL